MFKGWRLTAEMARSVLWQDNDPKGFGDIYWRESNRLLSEPGPEVYRYVEIYGERFYAAHIAWLLHYGEWPRGKLKRRNRVRSDDRVENLRPIGEWAATAPPFPGYWEVADLV